MALNPIPGFTSGSYELASPQASIQRSLNLFAEAIEGQPEKVSAYLRGSPGLNPPLITLPTAPLRAIQECGAPLSASSRMFAVAGSKLYEVFAGTVTTGGGVDVTLVSGPPFSSFLNGGNITINGLSYPVLLVGPAVTTLTLSATVPTYSTPVPFTAFASHGDVGNDNLPAQILPNGNQVGVVSAGQFWCDNGGGIIAPHFPGSVYTDLTIGWGGNNASVALNSLNDGFSGKASATGTAVTWVSGDLFTAAFAGAAIQIGIATYQVATFNSTTSLTLVAGPGAPVTNLFYIAHVTGDPAFNAGMVGLTMTVSGLGPLVVASVSSPTTLSFTTNTGVFPAASKSYFISSSTFTVASQLNPFTQADVGSSLAIPASTGFNANTYVVASVDSYGNAKLTVGGVFVPVGTPGATGGGATQTLGPVQARTGAFLDSFYIINPPNSQQIYVSGVLDGTTWDPLDVATKESYPDKVGAVLADHQELLVLGESHSEVWVAPGANPIFPFQPNEGYAMAIGVAAPWSACSMRDGPVWIGSSLRGQPIAYFAQGFQPQRISTHAIEQIWAKFPVYPGTTLRAYDATGFIYEIDGHELWQITFPTADQTWVYDRTASLQMGKPMWHERSSFDPTPVTGGQHRHRASCQAFVFGGNYVGDFGLPGAYGAGNIYLMSDLAYRDNGQPITCQRVFPHLSIQRLREFFTKFQLDMQTGGGVALTVVLDWSDDGGVNFNQGGGANFTYVTSTTLTIDRAVFWALGSATDRVFRLTVTGNCPVSLIDGYLDTIQGYS